MRRRSSPSRCPPARRSPGRASGNAGPGRWDVVAQNGETDARTPSDRRYWLTVVLLLVVLVGVGGLIDVYQDYRERQELAEDEAYYASLENDPVSYAESPQEQFVSAVRSRQSYPEDDSVLISVGEFICSDLAHRPRFEVEAEFRQSSYTPGQRLAIWEEAQQHLC